MKRLYLLAGLFLPIMLNADPVTPGRAISAAGRVLGVKSSDLRMLCEERVQTKGALAPASYYVFGSEDKGFAIIAGDDSVQPVIGYSRENGFDSSEIPVNLKSWLDMWSAIIESVRSGKTAPDKNAGREWASLENSRHPVCGGNSKQLETAQWGQGAPFNNLCPLIGGQSVTGCVATATCIAMRYHKWPERGHGFMPSYTYTDDSGKSHSIDGYELSSIYDWDSMPLKIDSYSSPDQQNMVAILMHDVGVMVKAMYGADGTAAYTEDAARGLVRYMGYDGSLSYRFKEYSSHEEWLSLLKDNIDRFGPVIYDGYGKDGGHCFILDGYNASNQFHINWGWGGMDNGFYSVPNFDTFTSDHGAILGMIPDKGGSPADLLCIDGIGDEPGISATVEEFRVGEPFVVNISYVFNMSMYDFNGEVGLVRVNREGEIEEVLGTDPVSGLGHYDGGGFYYDVVLSEINIGDFLTMAFRSDNHPEWTLMGVNRENGTVGELYIADRNTIEEVTSMKYVSDSGILSVSTKKDASYSLLGPDGAEVTAGVSFRDGVLRVDCNRLVKGTYTLTLTKQTDSKTISLVMGRK